jgi:hypothetical protein
MSNKSINLHDVINITNCKSIEDRTVVLGKGESKTPCRTIIISQNYDGILITTTLNLFGQDGQNTVPMEV